MALFVFAHQDDEVAAAPRILFELRQGQPVFCTFLTDGGTKVPAGTRDRESLAVLTRLGVPAEHVSFIGTAVPVRDGALVESLDVALDHLDRWMAGKTVESVYCLAWEGGHQDHDASQLVAAAFAKRRGLLDRCFELPLYRKGGPLFRVFSPARPRMNWQTRRLSAREGWRMSMLAWRYPSQRMTWLGLFPEAFVKFVVFRRELVRNVDPARFRSRPESNPMLYETRFRFPYDRFARASAAFIAQNF